MKKRCFNCMKEYEEQYEVCPHCGYVDGSPPAEAYHLAPGEILNHKYIVGTAIDSGGFGIIYRAWDAQMEQVVAYIFLLLWTDETRKRRIFQM